MKDIHFLYCIVILAVGSILFIFVSYATDNLPKQTPRNASDSAITLTPKTKNCGCCAKLTPQEHKVLRKKLQTYKKSAELLKEYGLKEGLRRIKAYDPNVSAQLEHFLSKSSAAAAH